MRIRFLSALSGLGAALVFCARALADVPPGPDPASRGGRAAIVIAILVAVLAGLLVFGLRRRRGARPPSPAAPAAKDG